MNNIISGTKLAHDMLANMQLQVTQIKSKMGIAPKLAIVFVGNNPVSAIYVNNKIQNAYTVGIDTLRLDLPSTVSSSELIACIDELNRDPSISGIIVQFPLPSHIDYATILSAVSANKDVDGFHPLNIGYLHSGSNQGLIPGTALGCLKIIKQCEQNLEGKNAVVVGRSNIVGKPLSALLLQENCTVTVCHSKTQNLSDITSRADIVILAVGSPLKFTTEYFNSNAIVLDVGINRLEGGIVGDVDFQNVAHKVKYITPVPGGVGPMTIAFLLKNTIKAFCNQTHFIPTTEGS